MDEQRFLDLVLSNPVNRVVLERGPLLGVDDRWPTAGAVFQTVCNTLDGRPLKTGTREVHETKARRRLQEWPGLVVDPW